MKLVPMLHALKIVRIVPMFLQMCQDYLTPLSGQLLGESKILCPNIVEVVNYLAEHPGDVTVTKVDTIRTKLSKFVPHVFIRFISCLNCTFGYAPHWRHLVLDDLSYESREHEYMRDLKFLTTYTGMSDQFSCP